jgi:hypothetical protein
MAALMQLGSLACAVHAALLALWSAPAIAEEMSRFARGIPVEGADQPVLLLEPCDLLCVAVVRFDTRLVTERYLTGAKAPAQMRSTLAVGDLEVAITIENGGGETPCRFRVLPPPGY